MHHRQRLHAAVVLTPGLAIGPTDTMTQNPEHPARLPAIMIAPNGARLKRADHPALPETIAEIVSTALACAKAGADGIHAHVRDSDGNHTLDEGLYRECQQRKPGSCAGWGALCSPAAAQAQAARP